MNEGKDPAWPLVAYVDKGRMMTLGEIATLVDLVRAGAKADPDAIRRECAEAAIAYMTDNTQLGINLIGLRQSIMNAGKE